MIEHIKVELGRPSDINSWMRLVRKVSWNFPGLETEQSIEEHKIIVLKFMNDKRALCVKNEEDIVGVLLYSRKHNIEYLSIFREDASGKSFGHRKAWHNLEMCLNSGDTVVVKDISRFSKNSELGYEKYMSFFNKNISLISVHCFRNLQSFPYSSQK